MAISWWNPVCRPITKSGDVAGCHFATEVRVLHRSDSAVKSNVRKANEEKGGGTHRGKLFRKVSRGGE